MADTKISALTELAAADVDRAADFLAIVDTGAAATKKITPVNLLNFSPITNSLSGTVALNNTGAYFTGPTVAQGTAGTWFASGTVCVIDGNGAADYNVKLWDGTTVIASASATGSAVNVKTVIALSGYIASPAGNIRISVNNATSTNSLIIADSSGNGKDSTLTAIRVG